MALIKIDAILWRQYQKATSSALWGLTKSQYYFELTGGNYDPFFGPNTLTTQDKNGNTVFHLTLEAFTGSPSPVPSKTILISKLRSGTQRAGSYQVLNQTLGNAYDLWQPNRGPMAKAQNMVIADIKKTFIIIVRDDQFKFHGRFIRSGDFSNLPQRIQNLLQKSSVGWDVL